MLFRCLFFDAIILQKDRRNLMAFYIRGLMAIISEWIREDCSNSIAYVAEMMQRCVKHRMEKL